MEPSEGTKKNKADAKQGDGAIGLYDRPLVLEGKRKRKSTELFSFNEKEKSRKPTAEYTGGEGVKLGDIPYIQHYIYKTKAEKLRLLFKLCYDRVGARIEVKRSLREFCGFTDPSMIEKKKAALEKLTVAGIKPVCEILGLETSGNKGDVISRIIKFLEKPFDHGKVPKTRRRSSTGSARKKSKLSESEGDDELEEDAIEQDKNDEGDDSAMDISQADEDNEEKSTEKEEAKANDNTVDNTDTDTATTTAEDQQHKAESEPTKPIDSIPKEDEKKEQDEKKEPEKEA